MQGVQDENRTVFLSSHNMPDVEKIADHIVMISNGQIHAEGSKDDLLARHRRIAFKAETEPSFPDVAILSLSKEDSQYQIETSDFEKTRSDLEGFGARDRVVEAMTLEDIFVAVVRKAKLDEE